MQAYRVSLHEEVRRNSAGHQNVAVGNSRLARSSDCLCRSPVAKATSTSSQTESNNRAAHPNPGKNSGSRKYSASSNDSNFSGRGSDTITVDFKGPVVVTTIYTYTDEQAFQGHFGITLLDGQGRQLDLIANHVGSTQGSKASRIPSAGRYYFNVDAPNGSWTIQFT